MSHTLWFSSGSYHVYVDDISVDEAPILAKHQILDAPYTTLQYMGGESYTKTIQFTATTSVVMEQIREYVKDGWQAYYVDDTGTSGSFVVSKFTYKRLQALNYAYPWFRGTLTMTNLPDSGSLYYQWLDPDAPPR